jgi:hypothetical protein
MVAQARTIGAQDRLSWMIRNALANLQTGSAALGGVANAVPGLGGAANAPAAIGMTGRGLGMMGRDIGAGIQALGEQGMVDPATGRWTPLPGAGGLNAPPGQNPPDSLLGPGAAGAMPGAMPTVGAGAASGAASPMQTEADLAARQASPGASAPAAPGGGSFSGGGGAVNVDAARAAGLGPAPTPLPGAAPGSLLPGAGGDPNARWRELTTEEALNEPQRALATALMDMGVNPMRNRYAGALVSRYGPMFGALAQIWGALQGQDPEQPADMARLFPQFIQYFMQGGDLRGLLQTALQAADTNPALKTALLEVGEERMGDLMRTVSGEGKLMRDARARLDDERRLREWGEQQRRVAAGDLTAGDEEAWLTRYQQRGR